MSIAQRRRSRLESYLKRNLPDYVYDDIRYYECCIVEDHKRHPDAMYVIVTGESVIMVTLQRHRVSEVVKLRDIMGIRVEHDYPTFLVEEDAHNCQHICISHSSRVENLEEEDEVEEGMGEVDGDENDGDGNNDEENDGDGNGDDEKDSDETEGDKNNLDETDGDKNDLDESGGEGESEKILEIATNGDDNSSSGVSLSASNPVDYKDLLPRRRGGLGPTHVDWDERGETPLAKYLREELGRLDRIGERRRSGPLPRHAAGGKRPDSSEAGEGEFQRSVSSLLRQVEHARPRPPRSYSSLGQQPSPRFTATNTPQERRSQSVLDKPRVHTKVRNNEGRTANIRTSPCEEIHIFILDCEQPILLNYLQSTWCAHLLNRTLQMSNEYVPKSSTIPDLLDLENLYHGLRSDMTRSTNDPKRMYKLFQELQSGFYKIPMLKIVFWKDQMLYHFIIEQLEAYMLSSKVVYNPTHGTYNEDDTDFLIRNRRRELKFVDILLDTLSAAFHETDNNEDKLKVLQFQNGRLLHRLIRIITSSPFIPSKFQNTCSQMLENYNDFSSYAWPILPEGVLISLIGTITNDVCKVLSELIVTIGKLAENNPFLSITVLFQDISMENYLKRNITQLLYLLFSSEQKGLDPEESVLLYNHFYVLKCLMDNLSNVKNYVKANYQEEFRYYILWSRIKSKLPERYPIKRVLQPLVEHVHRMSA